MTNTYDVIIVGAGSSGGALAARLSEDSSRQVLVLEGGPAYRGAEEMPQELLSPSSIAAAAPGHPNNWAYMAELKPGFRFPYPRGRGVGGSSSINGCQFVRGTKADFDTWVKLGNPSWSHERVLESYKRSEHDLDIANDAHGTSGPIPVRREPRDRAPEFTAAFEQACLSAGFPAEPDKNDPITEGGIGPVPLNVDSEGRRVGTALGYVLPALGRSNLTVIGGAVVRRILLDGRRAIGVEARIDGELQQFHGSEVVISAGALRTPHLLMVSGIGPADHLKQYGFGVVQDLPGVGQNLTEHPMASAAWQSKVDFVKHANRGVMTSSLNWSAEGSEMELLPFVARNGDMLNAGDVLQRPLKAAGAMKGTSVKAVARQAATMKYAMLGIIIYQEESRGAVALDSSDPDVMPNLSWNLLASSVDRMRLRSATRTAFDIFHSSELKGIGAEIVGLTAKVVNNDEALDQWVAEKVAGGHPSSTCRMGPDSDESAVVDDQLRVYGIEGLRIADTSVFPAVPSRGPNATAIMVGEHLATMMTAGASA